MPSFSLKTYNFGFDSRKTFLLFFGAEFCFFLIRRAFSLASNDFTIDSSFFFWNLQLLAWYALLLIAFALACHFIGAIFAAVFRAETSRTVFVFHGVLFWLLFYGLFLT